MAGGPPRNQSYTHNGVNIDVTGGGVQTGTILAGNTFRGPVTSRTNYTGPPPIEGAHAVVPRQQDDGTITLKNVGSHSHQTIATNNTFEHDAAFEQNVNLRPEQNNEGRNEELMDLR